VNPCLRSHPEGVYLSVRLQPRASASEIVGLAGTELKIRVTAPPVDSAANEALLRLLAERLNCPRNSIELVRGQTSRSKVVFLRGLSSAEVEGKLCSQK
jgi:uncharacterized protein (TIGR00251 family)